jgi:catechol 2,3-dioxygenase-like lactoylglutathione lyase family enzyme
MDIGFDPMAIVVRDVDAAEAFFALLGFERTLTDVIEGPAMEQYMDVPGIVADHITLALRGAPVLQQVQLVRYRSPEVEVDPQTGFLGRTGFNHLCFRIEDLDAVLDEMRSHGVEVRSQIMEFHDRRLVFLVGPEGITIELAQWLPAPH